MSGQKKPHQKLLQLDLCDPLDQLVRCHEDSVGLGHGSQPEPLAWLVGVCQSHKKREEKCVVETKVTLSLCVKYARAHTHTHIRPPTFPFTQHPDHLRKSSGMVPRACAATLQRMDWVGCV
jgi:hypothetical protein